VAHIRQGSISRFIVYKTAALDAAPGGSVSLRKDVEKMREVVIVSGARTPVGSFQGALAAFQAPRLGAIAIRAALERARVPADAVGEV
jgi:hypothetical protein